MSIIDWFDPHNMDHLQALNHLNNEGAWPEGFLPEEIQMINHWYFMLMVKVADCWMTHKLQEEMKGYVDET